MRGFGGHVSYENARRSAAAVGHRAWLGCLVEKNITSSTSAHVFAAKLSSSAQAWMLESRAERSTLAAAPDIAVVDVGLNFMSPKT